MVWVKKDWETFFRKSKCSFPKNVCNISNQYIFSPVMLISLYYYRNYVYVFYSLNYFVSISVSARMWNKVGRRKGIDFLIKSFSNFMETDLKRELLLLKGERWFKFRTWNMNIFHLQKYLITFCTAKGCNTYRYKII